MLSHLKKKTPHRFHFEIIPKRCDGLHAAPGVLSVVCESGSKISYTEPSPWQDDGTAEFRSVMRMTSTIYKQDHSLLPKEYTFKVQLIRDASSRMFAEQQRRRTIARGKLNMAEFCSHTSTPAAAEVLVPLHPQGTLTLAIRAVWLQQYQQPAAVHAAGETDSVTEYSSQTRSSFDNDTASMDSGSTGCGPAVPSPSAASPIPPSLDTRAGAGAATVSRTSSADLSSLTDYHLRVNSITVKQQAELQRVVEEALAEQQPEQQQLLLAGQTSQPVHQGHAMSDASSASTVHLATGASGGSAGLLSAARLQKASSLLQQQQGPASMTNGIPSKMARVARLRTNSAPTDGTASLRCIDPIIETDKEGHDCAPCGASSLERALSEDALRAHLQAVGSDNPFLTADSMVSSSPEPRLHHLQHPRHQQQWAAGLQDEGLPETADESPAGLRGLSGHLRGWMWPFSRDYVKDVTTDELMRQIEARAKDAPKLQQLCRGLLVERNDWRYKATQWERNSQALQEQVDALNNTKLVLVNQLMAAEGQLAQLQKNALLDKLVETKLELAQSDLRAAELQGQLAREQERSKQLATRLTVLQSKHECLTSQHASVQQQLQQQHKQPAMQISPFQAASQIGGDQGQGEGLMSPAADASPSVPSMRRSGDLPASSTSAAGGGWGWGQWMRGGSFVGRSSSASGQPVH